MAQSRALEILDRLFAMRVHDRLLPALKEESSRWRLGGHDVWVRSIRRHYSKQAEEDVKRALSRRFVVTGARMPLPGTNPLRSMVEHDAASFDYAPVWTLHNAKTKRTISARDARAKELARIVRVSNIDSLLVELEQRALPAGQVARVDWDGLRSAWTMRLFWTDHVLAVPHWKHPGDSSRLLYCAARVAGPDPRREVWDVWGRRALDDEGDEFTEWESRIVDDEGGVLQEDEVEPGRLLPYVLFQPGEPDFGPFVAPDRELVTAAETLIGSWSNLLFTTDYQAASERIHYSDQVRPGGYSSGGPGTTSGPFPTKDRIEALDFAADLAAMESVVDKHARQLAVDRQQSEDAYSAERTGAPLTGVSRRVKNEAQDLRRRKLRGFAETFITDQLIPVLVDVHARGTAEEKLRFDADGLELRAELREPPDFEDPVQAAARGRQLFEDGVISKARYGVLAGEYPTISAAVDAGLSDEIPKEEEKKEDPAGPPPPPPPGTPPVEDAQDPAPPSVPSE